MCACVCPCYITRRNSFACCTAGIQFRRKIDQMETSCTARECCSQEAQEPCVSRVCVCMCVCVCVCCCRGRKTDASPHLPPSSFHTTQYRPCLVEETLTLHATVVRASDTELQQPVRVCLGCVQRERKRRRQRVKDEV